MVPVLALNLVEILEAFKIPNLADYDFTYYGLPNDPLHYKDPMVFIDLDKALILPGTECVILCTRKVDREIVTAVKITSIAHCNHIEVERVTGSIEVGMFMKDFCTAGFVDLAIAYIESDVDPLTKSNPAAIWEAAHVRQEQLNGGMVELDFSGADQTNTFAKKELTRLQNIEDFGVADPKPC